MIRRLSKETTRQVIFFLILVGISIFTFSLPVISAYYHQIQGSPKIENGVLDLQNFDFNSNLEVPLNGDWEFFWHRWIITEQEENPQPDLMGHVPLTWSHYKLNGKRLPTKGFASYRLTLINCPLDIDLVSYVPNLNAAYQVFINGRLVAIRGSSLKTPSGNPMPDGFQRSRLNLSHKSTSELVIEVANCHTGGLYVSPILAENVSDDARSNLHYIVSAAYMGILSITLFFFIYIVFSTGITLSSASLLALNSLVFLRILTQDEFFGAMKLLSPIFRHHSIHILVQLLTLFFPVLFLLCAKQFIKEKNSSRHFKQLVLFELALTVPLSCSILRGNLLLQNILALFSLIPFLPVLRRLYRRVKQGQPYSFAISLGILLTLSSILISNQISSGLAVMNLSLYPATCAVLTVIIQGYIYVQSNNKLRQEALEAADLRLKLQESQMSSMMSQIRPHFLYNALIAIQVLCTREPETAAEAVFQFAKYLRANMQSISNPAPIPFTKELEHIKNYVSIERLRFQDRLAVQYEIGTEAFQVPPLTIQPLVENAIKHGACKNITGGTVLLKTYETEDAFWVQVTDDGPGFHPETAEDPSKQSYGLRNISFRLRQMMGAEIKLQSEPDCGTTVLVKIPKEAEAPNLNKEAEKEPD